MASGVKISGLRETIRALEKLGVEASDLKEAFGRISQQVAHDAEGLVRVETGAHRGSIRPARTKNKAVVRAGNNSTAPAAGVLNYGWPAHNIEGDEFLTGPANRDIAGKAHAIEANLQDLIRRYRLN